jgi:very-short-patch-repair endonuclease
LIIELDGSQHAEAEISRADDERTRVLDRLGFVVLRFWNGDVRTRLPGVLDTIVAVATERLAPSSAPSGHLLPEGEGKERQDTP